MKIIYNNIIPFKGYMAINLFGILFVRSKYKGKVDKIVINHEKIHTVQMKELLWIFFYIIYFLEYLVKIIIHGNLHTAYRNISFEKEAYINEENMNYLKTRKCYQQWRKRNKN